MAETGSSTQYNLPPQYIQDYLSGGKAGIPGLFPLLNASMANQFNTMGNPGATPFTYGGQRIAGFDPREKESFALADSAIGSYLPFMQQQEGLYNQGIGAARSGAAMEESLAREGLRGGIAGIEEGAQRLRDVQPRFDQQLNDARGYLQTSGQLGLGATQQFDPRMAEQYFNPYEDQVVQQALKDTREGLSQADMGLRGNAVSSGAFGGSRGRITSDDLARQVGRGTAEAVGGLRSTGYQNALSNASNAFEQQQRRQAGAAGLFGNLGGGLGSLAGQQAGLGADIAGGIAGLGLQGGNLFRGTGSQIGNAQRNLSANYGNYGSMFGNLGNQLGANQRADIGLLGAVGGANRNMNQAGLDLDYNNFVGQYNLPAALLGQYSGIAQGISPLAGGSATATRYAPGIDYLSSGLGGFSEAFGNSVYGGR
tara:strand:- start:5873 stop:7147 length:1275 start_codon:yes stop_codon:yes gene_type:complete